MKNKEAESAVKKVSAIFWITITAALFFSLSYLYTADIFRSQNVDNDTEETSQAVVDGKTARSGRILTEDGREVSVSVCPVGEDCPGAIPVGRSDVGGTVISLRENKLRYRKTSVNGNPVENGRVEEIILTSNTEISARAKNGEFVSAEPEELVAGAEIIILTDEKGRAKMIHIVQNSER